MNRVLIFFVRIYQYTLSPMLGQRCKYYPTCSNYAIDALREYGAVRGSVMAAWRLLRCNPFSNGGYDPVTPRHRECEHGHPESNVSTNV